MTSAAEWLTALASLGTFVVIAASAIAALLQLRHMRSSNQISAYNECRETMETQAFRDALAFIRNDLPKHLEGAGKAEEIVRGGLVGEYGSIRLVANLFESMGLFVKVRMMEERIACELWSGIVLDAWNKLRPITKAVRTLRPGVWINFEYMAALGERYIEEHPDGEYPHDVKRMPLEEPAEAS